MIRLRRGEDRDASITEQLCGHAFPGRGFAGDGSVEVAPVLHDGLALLAHVGFAGLNPLAKLHVDGTLSRPAASM